VHRIVAVVTNFFLLGSALMTLNPPDIAILSNAMDRGFDPFNISRVLLERTGLRPLRFEAFSDQVVDIHQHFDYHNTTEQPIATLRDVRPSVSDFAALATRPNLRNCRSDKA
jgi:hypothetical protein